MVISETEEDLVISVELEDISDAISAALTSGANDFQDSKIAAGNNGDGKADAPSLFSQNRSNLQVSNGGFKAAKEHPKVSYHMEASASSEERFCKVLIVMLFLL